MNARKMAGIAVVAMLLTAGVVQADITIETVTVGNLGNAGELSGASLGGNSPDGICGAVAYIYRIGKYEVTAGQYTAFLNKVAATDTYGLYNPSMDTAVYLNGCNIKRTGSPGSYSYTVAADWANRPVNLVSWGDAARFANWLANSQPTGPQDANTTEDGAYYLNGATTREELLAVTRKVNATWVIPSEDEWYKAAYHKNDGATGNYWDYPTSSNSEPSNVLGNPTDPGNHATYYNYVYTIGSPYYRTEVGAHENSASPYGTFDQGGNIWEWNETVIGSGIGTRGGFYRHLAGGNGSRDNAYTMQASYRDASDPSFEGDGIGFRIAEVPEPATLSLLALGGLAVIRRRRT